MAAPTHANARERQKLAQQQQQQPDELVGKCANTDDAGCLDTIESFKRSLEDVHRNTGLLRDSFAAADEVGKSVAAAELRAALEHAGNAIATAPTTLCAPMTTMLANAARDAWPLLAQIAPDESRPDGGDRAVAALCGPNHGSGQIRTQGFAGYRKGAPYSTTVQVVAGRAKPARIDPDVYAKFSAMRDAAKLEVTPQRPAGIVLELESGARTNDEQRVLRKGWEDKQDSTIKNAGLHAHAPDEHATVKPLSAGELRRLQSLRVRAGIAPLVPKEQRELRDLGWRYLSPAERAQVDQMLAQVLDRDTMYALAKLLGKSADAALEHFNLAAKPGSSNHQDPGGSQAIDIAGAKQASSAVYQWLRAHANEYGFIRTVASENWHWEYRPGWTGYEHGHRPRRG